jgi:hypothetical protein
MIINKLKYKLKNRVVATYNDRVTTHQPLECCAENSTGLK